MSDKDLNQQDETGRGEGSYEPPSIELIGTIEQLTLSGAPSGKMDLTLSTENYFPSQAG